MRVADELSVLGGTVSGGGSLEVGTGIRPATKVIVDAGGVITGLKSIDITANRLYVAEENSISLNGGSNLEGQGFGGNSGGASHGGSGGSGVMSYVGTPYGSYAYPQLAGSRGGAPDATMGIYLFSLFISCH